MDNQDQKNNQNFSLAKRAKSFGHAGRGIGVLLKSTHNVWMEIILLVIAVIMGIYFQITNTEWLFIILAGGLVLASEAFNTAIEIHMSLTSAEYHPTARDTKDVAAGAVLLSALTALVVGIIIFLPHILIIFSK